MKLDETLSNSYKLLRNLGWLLGTSQSPLTQRNESMSEIQRGNLYQLTSSGSIPNTNTINFACTTGSEYLHFIDFTISTSDKCIVSLYEDTVFTGGTTSTPINKNRASNNNCLCTIKNSVTVSSNGTLLASMAITSSGHGANTIGSSGSIANFILDKNKNYIVTIYNDSGNTINYNTSFIFYEDSIKI